MLEMRFRRALLPAVVVAVVLALGGPASAQEDRTLFVLSVGCPGQKNSDPDHLRPHKVGEAQRVAALFKAQEGKLFGRVVDRCLTGPEATRNNICGALADLQRQAQTGDRVVLYFNGHGGTDPRAGWMFETYDFDPRAPLATADLRDTVGTLPARGVGVVVFVSTCNAGALNLQSKGVVVLASSLAHEASISVPPEDALDGRGFSIFSRALEEGMAGKADANGDGVVTLVELELYVAKRVPEIKADLARRNPTRGYDKVAQQVTCGKPLAVPSNLALVKTGPSRPRPGRPAVALPRESNPGR